MDRAKFFLERGGGGDELRDSEGTLLIMRCGSTEVLEFLLDRGADVDATSPTAGVLFRLPLVTAR